MQTLDLKLQKKKKNKGAESELEFFFTVETREHETNYFLNSKCKYKLWISKKQFTNLANKMVKYIYLQ